MFPWLPWPVPGHEEVSSHYGDRREYNEYKLHLGTDVRAPTGAAVVAGAGQIIFAGWAGNAGRSVYLDMGAYRVHYCHLNGFNVTADKHVASGEVIGWVGGSGNGQDDAYDPHLHVNVFAAERPATGPSHWVAWVGMWAVDPELYLGMEDDMATLEQMQATLDAHQKTLEAFQGTLDAFQGSFNAHQAALEAHQAALDAHQRALEAGTGGGGGIKRGDTVKLV